jgi:hypothetical protein
MLILQDCLNLVYQPSCRRVSEWFWVFTGLGFFQNQKPGLQKPVRWFQPLHNGWNQRGVFRFGFGRCYKLAKPDKTSQTQETSRLIGPSMLRKALLQKYLFQVHSRLCMCRDVTTA